MPMFDTLAGDLRLAVRTLVKSPAFSLAALAALTLGIGVNTAIFSVVNAVLLQPLPYPEPDRIVFFTTVGSQGQFAGASPAKFAHFRAQNEVTRHAAAFTTTLVNLTEGTFPEQLRSARVSADFFTLFGVTTAAGRTFTADEDRPGGGRVAVLSHGLWASQYAADPGIVGRAIALDGQPYTVVGVLGETRLDDVLQESPQLYLPFQLDTTAGDHAHYFQTAGRLLPGVSLEQAQARLQTSAADFRARFGGGALGPNSSFGVEPIGRMLVRNVRSSLLVLSGAVGFVLLIACANVANLLLVRATGRRRELAVRAALGASRGQIVRQLLTESLILSAAGGALGLALGALGIRALLSINTASLPRVGADGALVGVDGRVLTFTMVVALGTGLLFGLLPALQGSRPNVTDALKEGGRSGSGGAVQGRTRAALVVTEVALALTLLVGSTLLIRSAIALGRVDPGFSTANVLTMRMALTDQRYATAAGLHQLSARGLERLRTLPGVTAATAACCVPLEGGFGLPFVIAGRPLADASFHGGAGWLTIGAGYFDVFQIPVRQGRVFTDRDDPLAPPVAVINEAMARQYWPDRSPIGERLVLGRSMMREFAAEPEREIIGVVGDTRDSGLNDQPGPTVYTPAVQMPDAVVALNLRIDPIGWMVRTAGAPGAMSVVVQEALREATGLPVSSVRSMDEVVARSTSRQRFNTWLMSLFGAAALLLAAIGIYGLMAYSVEQRTRELGVRLALGADAGGVRRMVIGQGMTLAAAGIGLGLAASFALSRLMTAFLFEVTATDPLVFVVAPLMLAVVSLAAVWLPARRASRVDPIEALRYE